MRRFYHTIFWIIAFVILTLTFKAPYGGMAQSFFFVSFLLPVIVGTSYLVTAYLVPRFLLRKRYLKFILYFVYTLVFSVYLEMLVMTLSLIIYANFQYTELNPKTTDIVFLTIVLYFFVFLNTIIFLIKAYFLGVEKQRDLETEMTKLEKGFLTVKSQRKKYHVQHDKIIYLESLGNYVRIVQTSDEDILTKETIGSIKSRLPQKFLRIHRSILVNREHIQSYGRETIILADKELPISRKYKEELMGILEGFD
jgi:hypothetical protein